MKHTPSMKPTKKELNDLCTIFNCMKTYKQTMRSDIYKQMEDTILLAYKKYTLTPEKLRTAAAEIIRTQKLLEWAKVKKIMGNLKALHEILNPIK